MKFFFNFFHSWECFLSFFILFLKHFIFLSSAFFFYSYFLALFAFLSYFSCHSFILSYIFLSFWDFLFLFFLSFYSFLYFFLELSSRLPMKMHLLSCSLFHESYKKIFICTRKMVSTTWPTLNKCTKKHFHFVAKCLSVFFQPF